MDTRFKKGRIPTTEENEKRAKGLKEAWKNDPRKHGMMGTKFHNSWRSMTTRCRGTAGEDSKKKYRDKGITVCERWLSFKNFYEDMFPTYIEGLTIDRINNSKGYYIENCRWATPRQQAENRSSTLYIEYGSSRLTVRQWAERLGLNYNTLRWNYYHRYMSGLISKEELFYLNIAEK